MLFKVKNLLNKYSSYYNFSTVIPASAVKKLRAVTGAPLMQCKKALETKDGDL